MFVGLLKQLKEVCKEDGKYVDAEQEQKVPVFD